MSGFSLAASPSSTPANTVYFGHVPDRLNTLKIGYVGHSPNVDAATSVNDANFVNQWTIYNQNQGGGGNVPTSSFGSFITAPDGTTNIAQKVVESATNTVHAVITIWTTNRTAGNLFKYRISVFAKAAERTRFALYVGQTFDPATAPTNNGYRTVFDLAGGQIGVAPTAYGNTGNGPIYVPGPAEIVPFGNGWYRCTMEAAMGQGAANAYGFGILLDNGSGTAAESTTYSGDGSSGVYFWRANGLPPAAYALNNTTFFDDFTSLSTIDLTNSHAPGFNWYINNQWPAFGGTTGTGGLTPTNPSTLSIVGGTKLKVAFSTPGSGDLIMMTSAWANTGLGTVSSYLYQPPALLEVSMSWDGFTNPPNPPPAFWTTNLFRLLGPVNTTDYRASEFDFFEWTPGGAPTSYPGYSIFGGADAGSIQFASGAGSAIGTPIWYSTFTYGSFHYFVYNTFDGQIYQLQNSVTSTGERPDLFPAKWTLIGAPSPGDTGVDWTQQHVFSMLWLPQTRDDLGQVLAFFDGRSVGQSQFIYGNFVPNLPGPPPPISQASIPFNVSDGQQGPILLSTCSNINMFIDYCRVTQ